MIALLIASVALSQVTSGDPASWYLSRAKENRASEIDDLSRQILRTRQMLIAAKKSRMKAEAAKAATAIEEMEQRVKALRAGKANARVPLDPENIAVGQAGNLGYAEVLQVTGPTSAIVRLKNPDDFTITNKGRSSRLNARGAEAFVWVEMESTAGMADGRLHKFEGLFEVAGTKMYRTPDGSTRSALLLKPFNLPP